MEFLKKKFLIWRYLRKGLQISPKSDTLIFFSKTANNFFGLWPEVSTKYDFQFEWNLFFRKISYLEIFDLEIVKKRGFGRFLDFASLVFLDFTHMIGGHDVYLFLYYSPVQSMYSCSIYNKSTFFSSHFFDT